MPSFLSPLVKNPGGSFRLVNERTGQLLADRLIGAFDSNSRKKGLLAHTSMPAGTAMIIAPTNAVHTFFMKFALDLLFVARDGSVVKTRLAVPPWRMSGAWRAHAVIELAAGTLDQSAIRAGDRVLVIAVDR